MTAAARTRPSNFARAVCGTAFVVCGMFAPVTSGAAAKPPDAKAERAAAEKAAESALRNTLRTATVQLAARAVQTVQAASGATPPRTLPLTVFVGPVLSGSETATSADDASTAAMAAYGTRAATMREIVGAFVAAAMTGPPAVSGDGVAVFALREPARKRRGKPVAEPTTEAAERETAQRAGADFLLEETLLPAANAGVAGTAGAVGDGASGHGAHLAFQIVDVRDGTVLCAADAALPELPLSQAAGRKN